jgi:peroxiredoxin
MISTTKAGAVAFFCSLILAGQALAKVDRADDFMLLDHTGKAQKLYYEKDAKAIVLIPHSNHCKINAADSAAFNALQKDYADQGVKVLMINSDQNASREAIAANVEKTGVTVPVLHDTAQIIGSSLEIENTGEVLVIEPGSRKIVYRGNGGQTVRNTIDALIAGTPIEVASLESKGCAIAYPHTAAAQTVTYADDIAPILMDNCTACHTEGGIAPWAMTEYNMVKGFAPMIREVIRTKRMPPWHADPDTGVWEHDGSISDEETRTLVSWIEAGAKRGDGPDPLLNVKPLETRWTLGEPDLILEVPAYDIPATGIVEYQFPVLKNPLGRDVWVKAATIIPGDGRVVHHVLMGSGPVPEKNGGNLDSVFDNYIMGYAVGNESANLPEGTGVFVPSDEAFLLQMHYTPIGLATTDKTRVGLYFADEVPANYLRTHVIVDPTIKIKPNSAEHEENAYFTFTDDATLYSVTAHAHYRGSSANYTLEYPNGETEVVLAVPNYDFNWQRTYTFSKPLQVPKGSKMVYSSVYDNSLNNDRNPDASRTVPWGEQSHDEMLYGSMSFEWNNETSAKPIYTKEDTRAAQMIGFMDSDMDGLLMLEELPESFGKRLAPMWGLLDANQDGGLDLAEIKPLLAQMEKARKARKAKTVASIR